MIGEDEVDDHQIEKTQIEKKDMRVEDQQDMKAQNVNKVTKDLEDNRKWKHKTLM